MISTSSWPQNPAQKHVRYHQQHQNDHQQNHFLVARATLSRTHLSVTSQHPVWCVCAHARVNHSNHALIHPFISRPFISYIIPTLTCDHSARFSVCSLSTATYRSRVLCVTTTAVRIRASSGGVCARAFINLLVFRLPPSLLARAR